jgi:four helix bundle protein
MGRYNDLPAYKMAFGLAMDIFYRSTKFPSGEKFGLTSLIRRSSRSVCSDIAEGYRQRTYKAHFLSKLTDGYMGNTETEVG